MLKPGSSRVSVGIRNLSYRKVTIPAKSTIAKIAAVNIVPHSYAPNIENNEQLQQGFEKYQQKQERAALDETVSETILKPSVLTPEKEKLLFSRIDLDGAKEWDEELKVKTKDLF